MMDLLNRRAPSSAHMPAQAAAPAAGTPGDDWAQLWFAVQQQQQPQPGQMMVPQPWSTLVLVPAVPGVSSRAAAQQLVQAARLYESRPVELVDACGATPGAVGQLVADVAERVAAGAWVIVAVDSPLANRAAIPISTAADAALLVVPLGASTFGAARDTIGTIGRHRFVGSVAVQAGR
jgi:hypothetical protein